jgi:hypothetical protein
MGVARHQSVTEPYNFKFSVEAISAETPCRAATFVVNPEPHTGARISARLCVGLTSTANVPLGGAEEQIARAISAYFLSEWGV